jgi:uncharacterized membrane protein
MTTTDPANPFEAPTARLEDYSQKASHLLAEARVVPAGAAMVWLRTGWEMFQEAPGAWIGIVFLYFLIIVIVSILPIIGVLNAVVSPVFAAGVILACEAQHRGVTPTVADLFGGFRRNTGNLMLIGILYMVGLMTVVFVMGGGAAVIVPFLTLGGDQAAAAAAPGVVLVLVLAALLLILPLGFTLWWSPALVAVHDITSFEAMKRSLLACLRNWRALLVYGVLALALCMVAAIPLGLGLFVAGPVVAISWWAGYRAIFVE